MKRELKQNAYIEFEKVVRCDCRAYPDEKGIETYQKNLLLLPCEIQLQSLSRWKGNWNFVDEYDAQIHDQIAEPIPMKRELKQ